MDANDLVFAHGNLVKIRSPWTGFAVILRFLAAGAVVVASLMACTSGSPSPSGTRTVTVTPSGLATASTSPTRPPPTPTPAPTPRMTRFSGDCYSLLSLYDVQQAIGHLIGGQTAFVVGLPEKNIGRLAYLNCRSGIPTTAPGVPATPQIEIGVTLYDTPAQAQRRATGTIQDYVANAATPAQVTVAGNPAVILTGGTGTGYTVPLLVTASGQRTVAVSLNDPAASAAQRTRILSALAILALHSTGG